MREKEAQKENSEKQNNTQIKKSREYGLYRISAFSYEGVSGDLDSEVIYWYMSAEIFFVFSLASEEFFILLDKTQNT